MSTKHNEFNILQVEPQQARRLIEHTMKVGRAVFVWGGAGIGKSDIMAQIAKDQNRKLIDIRLILMEPTDLKGIPYFDSIDQKMKWSVSEELPQHGELLDENAILFLDELNSAPQSVQGAAYQLILNRKIGAYDLPKGVSIVAAGNRKTDRGVVYEMPGPLRNRFVHINMTHSFDDWTKWAVNNGVRTDIISYLKSTPTHLCNFDAKSVEQAFATPRSWTFASELLNGDLDEEDEKSLLAGTVGQGVALNFIAHKKLCDKLPNPQDILSGKLKKLKEDLDKSIQYSLVLNLCYTLQDMTKKKKAEVASSFENYLSFTMSHFEPEMVAFSLKTLLDDMDVQIDMSASAEFDNFVKKYGKYMPKPSR